MERVHKTKSKYCNFVVNLLLLLIGITGVEPLKDVQIAVPVAATSGENVPLKCYYKLDADESLYTVKWYKDQEEFFRYVPKEIPAIQVFHIDGLDLDLAHSDNQTVTLRSVRNVNSGTYSCEVSADAPTFDTGVMKAHMTVVEFPEKKPLIEVAKYRYEVGDRIRANCSFGPSRPEANITWFINEVPVKSSYVNNYPLFDDSVKGFWVKSSLEMEAYLASFRSGRLKLKCLASVFSMYRGYAEVTIEEEKPRVGASKDSSGSQVMTGLGSSSSGSSRGGSGKSGSVTQSLSSSSTSSVLFVANSSWSFRLLVVATILQHFFLTSSSSSSILTQHITAVLR